ncbi:hypothetical protein [Gloeobacter violaceus]|uniref:hypothetical protein n=1 Tax=Gloeobacter violaceus TaxID=33072 RepID=UPI0013E8E842|nr:hypothetical protein [Gloeobacter violaceus]
MKPMKLLSRRTPCSDSSSLLSSLDYRLYRLGWNHRLHCHPHPVTYVLMSLSYLYRRGFKEAAAQHAAQHADDAGQ